VIERTDCAICDKNFDSTDTLRNHIRNVHECDPDDIFGTGPTSKRRAKKTVVVEEEVEVEEEEGEEEEEEVAPANTSAGSLISSKTDGNGVVVREFLVDEGDGNAQTILLENEVYTILPLDAENASETPVFIYNISFNWIFQLGHINCPDCPKSFKTQTSYERHIFITHSELNDYPCSICNAKLRSSALLMLHEEQHKSRGKPFACKICGKDFTRSYHLKRHQKYSSCSANENDTMSCKVCDRVFYRLDNLRAHLKQHLGTQVVKKPEYMCHVCKNCFYSLSTLK